MWLPRGDQRLGLGPLDRRHLPFSETDLPGEESLAEQRAGNSPRHFSAASSA
jgi:hypothetical protein